jgi:hypothetical protein
MKLIDMMRGDYKNLQKKLSFLEEVVREGNKR